MLPLNPLLSSLRTSLSFLALLLPCLSRAAVGSVLATEPGGGPPLLASEPTRRFFRKSDVDFWGSRKRKQPAPAAARSLFPESPDMPEPVRRLVEEPTAENGRRYLEWQQERAKRMTAALQALETARASLPEILFFSRPDCPACRIQESLLESLPARVVRLEPGGHPELWKKYSVTSVPTLVVGDQIFRGVTPAPVLEALLEKHP